MHCHNFHAPAMSRREMLGRCANGFGALALAALASEWNPAQADSDAERLRDPLRPRPPHFKPRAKNVIFLFMDGGPSQVDTFDPKPRLAKEHGEPIKMKVPPTQFNNVGKVLKSPWEFRQRGQSGLWVSDLFPNVAECADDLCVVRSLTSNFSEHTAANYFMHSGSGLQGRPSMGAWITYGLGSACRDLPGFVVLESGMIPPGGRDLFNSGFLPASYQGSCFHAGESPVADLKRSEPTSELQQQKLALAAKMNRRLLAETGANDELEAAIANYELAFKMQTTVPELCDFRDETAATHKLYGLDDKATETYGRQCLVARRLIERGVRFIELLPPAVGVDRWDQHTGLKSGHEKNARATDRGVAALLKDLKARGLLDETLVVWGGEFGRTPMAQGSDGRDHNPFGFTMWMAGGGVKGGFAYGQTDDYGYYAVENKLEVHDLHATILHLLGVEHTRQTYRFGGRDMRLTDVFGEVVHDLIA